ncbi:hypothetical protein [uncultured Prevotella sp.]|uniref:hypothetical protein n=1 Tax=uncultured Prevotella sp. TaxID=159272 RepID=UPI0026160C66|nr:hypothetical protein [uncultured Prevotella sp.]
MKRYIKILMACSIVIFSVSCGKQHKAESVVKDFLDKNITEPEYSISFNSIDSTKNITDSMINVMKNNAKKDNLFKKEIAYGSSTGSKPYIFTKTRIYNGKDTMMYTFYIDRMLQSVIAFKQN